MRAFKIALLLSAIGLVLWRPWSSSFVDQPPGILAPDAPAQAPVKQPRGARFTFQGIEIEPIAEYRIQARLLSRKAYSSGREAELSPFDFALGWGPMSDSQVLSALTIKQSQRFFWVKWPAVPPVTAGEMMRHAANTHLIPADRGVRHQLDQMKRGQLIELKGRLVNARTGDGWRWRSSVTRNDTGAGACELLLVEEARVLN